MKWQIVSWCIWHMGFEKNISRLMGFFLGGGKWVSTKNEAVRKKSGVERNLLYSNVAYDSAFRTMESECDDILIPFVNYLFCESYRDDAVVSRMRNEQFSGGRNHSSQKRITDSNFRITQDGVSKSYHLECESKPYDGSLLVRFFEYDSQIAKADSDIEFSKLKVRIPNAGLLLLRGPDSVPDRVCIEIETPEGSVSYHVAVVKESDFTIDKIFEKRLYLMIPFYIFNYEKDLSDINKDEDRIKALKDFYKDIIAKLDEEHEQGRLSALSHGVIIRLTHSVIHKFLMKYKNVQKKVGDVMGGEVLDLPEIRIAHEAEARGMMKERVRSEAERKTLQAEIDALRKENERLKRNAAKIKS